MKSSCMFALCTATAARLDPDYPYVIAKEIVEQPDRVRAAADARDEQVGQATFLFKYLRPGFAADNALKIANHRRVRVRPQGRAEKIIAVSDVGDPVAKGLAYCVLKRS